jgi:hypothetical protein
VIRFAVQDHFGFADDGVVPGISFAYVKDWIVWVLDERPRLRTEPDNAASVVVVTIGRTQRIEASHIQVAPLAGHKIRLAGVRPTLDRR